MAGSPKFRVLGPLEVERDDHLVPLGGSKPRTLLALLLASANTFVSVDSLIHGIWGEEPPPSAAHAVQVYVSQLRSELGADVIERGHGGYRLVTAPDSIDASQFHERCVAGQTQLAAGNNVAAAEEFAEALAMWRGQPYGELAYTDALDAECRRLEEMRLRAQTDRMGAEIARGRHADVVGELTALSHAHPLDERLRRHLATCLYRLGRQADAVRALSDYRSVLAEKTGLEPSPELDDLEQLILQQRLPLLGRDSDATEPVELSIAVLPFEDLSADQEFTYLAEGIAHELIYALTKISRLFVIARASSFSFSHSSQQSNVIGRELGVRYLLTGTIRVGSDRLRLSAELIEAATKRQLWAERFDVPMSDVFSLQDEIVGTVVAQIGPTLQRAERERTADRQPTDLEAYHLYLRALASVYQMTREAHDEALRLLEQALDRDDGYAPALALAAWVHALAPGQGWSGEDTASLGIDMARRAVAAAPADGEVLAVAGYAEGFLEEDVPGGLLLLDRALELNPNFAQGWGYRGWLRLYAGEAASALGDFQRSLSLSPRDPWAFRTHSGLAFANLFTNNYEEALKWASLAVHENRHYGPSHRALTASLALAGYEEPARSAAQRLYELTGDDLNAYASWTRFRHWPPYRELLVEGLRIAGLPEEEHPAGHSSSRLADAADVSRAGPDRSEPQP